MKKIVVDCYGGDNAPEEIVKGALDALDAEKNLSLMGINFVSGDNRLQNFGGNPKPFVPDSFSDHRIAMAFSVAAAALSVKPIYDACVTKSYPNFFEELERICQN